MADPEIGKWLRGAGLGRFFPRFEVANISCEDFLELVPSDFDLLGVEKPAERKRLRDLVDERRRIACLPRRPSPPRIRKVTEASIERERELEERRIMRERAKSEVTEPKVQLARVSVCVRKRPLSPKEVRKSEKDIIQVGNETELSVFELKEKVDLTKYVETHLFAFDRVFSEDHSNENVYEHTAKPLVEALFRGGRGTCFAYGQTGAGKTFTMAGDGLENPGLYSLAIRDVFNEIEAVRSRRNSNESDGDFGDLEVWISFFEIYGSRLHDLLGNRSKLECREDGNNEVRIVGLTERLCDSEHDVMDAIDEGNSNRSTGVTGANDDSSRSHAVFQIELRRARDSAHCSESTLMKKSLLTGRKIEELAAADGRGIEVGRLCFIDLAGSERGSDTANNDKVTRLEGAEINKSLLALKECIRAMGQRKDHTPFRGSKLTQVLKASFIGRNCRTVMIANVSPAAGNVEHTLNTLRYSYRVKEIPKDKLGPNPNATFSSTRTTKGRTLRVRRATLASGVGLSNSVLDEETSSDTKRGTFVRGKASADSELDRRRSDAAVVSAAAGSAIPPKQSKNQALPRPTRRITRSFTRATQIAAASSAMSERPPTPPFPETETAEDVKEKSTFSRPRTSQSVASLPPRHSKIPQPPRTSHKAVRESNETDSGLHATADPEQSSSRRARIPRRSTMVALPPPVSSSRTRANASSTVSVRSVPIVDEQTAQKFSSSTDSQCLEEEEDSSIPSTNSPTLIRSSGETSANAESSIAADAKVRPKSAGWLPDSTVDYFSGADETDADFLFKASSGTDLPKSVSGIPPSSSAVVGPGVISSVSETSRSLRDETHTTGLRDVIRHHHMQIEELMRLCEMDVKLVKAAEDGLMDPAEYALKLDMNLSQKLDMVISLKAKVGWLTSDKP